MWGLPYVIEHKEHAKALGSVPERFDDKVWCRRMGWNPFSDKLLMNRILQLSYVRVLPNTHPEESLVSRPNIPIAEKCCGNSRFANSSYSRYQNKIELVISKNSVEKGK